MKILITGAAGYVGSTLAQMLIRKNYDVHLIDNYSVPSNITSIDNVPIECIDIKDKLDLSDYDTLFHLAAISGIDKCHKETDKAWETNVEGTENLLKSFNGKVIFASTSAVYGQAHHPEVSELHPARPVSFYGTTKLEAERIVREQPNYVILRFSNIYGRGLFCKRTVTDIFIESVLKKEVLLIHGDGKQRRDFVHINDAILAYWCAMKSNFNGIYNIGGNEALSINEIASLVMDNYRDIFKVVTEGLERIPKDCGRKWHDFIYSSEKAKQELNYDPSYKVRFEIRSRLNAHKTRNRRKESTL